MNNRTNENKEPVAVGSDSNEGLGALSHEIWAAAQLAPGEGILHGAVRVENILLKDRKRLHDEFTVYGLSARFYEMMDHLLDA